MPKIAITQRVDIYPDRSERRDALDQRWYDFVNTMGYTPIALPNNLDIVRRLMGEISFEGVILTGGNNFKGFNGDSPERDVMEDYLIQYCLMAKIPLMAVCRGMQFILHRAGAEIVPVTGHVGTHHAVHGVISRGGVNSYHNLGCVGEVPDYYQVLAVSPDGGNEAVYSQERMQMGIMWHPERNEPYDPEDVELFQEFFGGREI